MSLSVMPRVLGLIPLSPFYRGQGAAPLGRWLWQFRAGWSALGLPPFGMAQVELRRPKCGRPIRLAVVLVGRAGRPSLVSRLGDCAWVRAARANPRATIVKLRRQEVNLEEGPVQDRAPIIQEFLRVAPGGRPHIGLGAPATLEDCDKIAVPRPVFRVVPG